MQSPNCNEAAEITALVVWFVVFVQPHLCGWPAFQIACAVDGAEAFSICWKAKAHGVCQCCVGSRMQSQKMDKRKGCTLQRSHLVDGMDRSGPAMCSEQSPYTKGITKKHSKEKQTTPGRRLPQNQCWGSSESISTGVCL